MKSKATGALFVMVALGVLLYLARCLDRGNYYISSVRRRNIPNKTKMLLFRELLSLVCECAVEVDVKVFLVYGTLLGYVRSKDFICHDFDVDLGVFGLDAYKRLFKKVKQVIRKRWYDNRLIAKDKSFFIWNSFEVRDTRTEINIDVSLYVITSDGKYVHRAVPVIYTRYFIQECPYLPVDAYLPLCAATMGDQQVYVPNRPHDVLRCAYGNDYLSPDHICDASCGNCRKRN